jgi:RNA polymerase sigma factor (sigma-70 family)
MTRLLDIQLSEEERQAVLARDEAARERLYRQLAGPVFQLIGRLVPLKAAREDVFQDTMLAVYEHLPRFRGEAPFGAWVRRIAVNRSFMYLRSPWQRARFWLSETDAPGSADSAGEPQTEEALRRLAAVPGDSGAACDVQRLLAQLAPTARAVVWLYEVEGWSHAEIAASSGRSISFSKSQLARAHARLRLLAQGAATPCRTSTTLP